MQTDDTQKIAAKLLEKTGEQISFIKKLSVDDFMKMFVDDKKYEQLTKNLFESKNVFFNACIAQPEFMEKLASNGLSGFGEWDINIITKKDQSLVAYKQGLTDELIKNETFIGKADAATFLNNTLARTQKNTLFQKCMENSGFIEDLATTGFNELFNNPDLEAENKNTLFEKCMGNENFIRYFNKSSLNDLFDNENLNNEQKNTLFEKCVRHDFFDDGVKINEAYHLLNNKHLNEQQIPYLECLWRNLLSKNQLMHNLMLC